jgi:VanZ family protein
MKFVFSRNSLESGTARLQGWGAVHPFWFYTAPLVAWAGAIAVASLVTPDRLPKFTFDFADKVEHGGCYAGLGLLMLRGWARASRPTLPAAALTLLAAAAWGLYLEYLQKLTGYRTFDWWDELANTAGAAAGVAFWVLASRWLVHDSENSSAADES